MDQQHRNREQGNSLVEYALILALIVIVCMAAVQLFSSGVTEGFIRTADSIMAP